MKKHIVFIGCLLSQKRMAALHGYFLWHRLNKKLGKNGRAILIPADDEFEVAELIFSNLDDYLVYNDSSFAIVIANSNNTLHSARTKCTRIKHVFKFNQKQIDSLIQYSQIYPIGNRLVIGSLKIPTTRLSIRNMIGKKGVSIEQIVKTGILGLVY